MKKLKRRWWSIYRDRKGHYRVRCRASNGKIVWASSEGYSRRIRAELNAEVFGAPCLAGLRLGDELRVWV